MERAEPGARSGCQASRVVTQRRKEFFRKALENCHRRRQWLFTLPPDAFVDASTVSLHGEVGHPPSTTFLVDSCTGQSFIVLSLRPTGGSAQC
jgi:hypothetical protein